MKKKEFQEKMRQLKTKPLRVIPKQTKVFKSKKSYKRIKKIENN